MKRYNYNMNEPAGCIASMGVLPRLPPVGAQVVGGNYAGPGFSLDVYRLTLPPRLVTRCRQGSSRGSAC